MLKIFFSIIFLVVISSATEMGLNGGSCTLAQDGAVKVNFTAYKTASKIGVSGSFEKVTYNSKAKSGKNFREIFVGSSVNIETRSVNTKNSARDNKLVKFFFEKMIGKNITAKILDYKPNKRFKGKPKTGLFIVEVTMNGISKIVPMNYIFNKGDMRANGVIDIFDFNANKALSSINRACFDLHKGKTWNDVAIEFRTKVLYSLCHVPKKSD
jgi:hypothetical protein